LGWFDVSYLTLPTGGYCYVYLILGLIDLTQLSLTITATVVQFGGTQNERWMCVEELPTLVMFELVLMIMGYLMTVRGIVT
jgi:hypothetical protein